MIWTLIGSLLLALVLALLAVRQRRLEKAALRDRLAAVSDAKEKGSHKAQLQFPNVDLSRCLGCGTCIRACPEEGVLELIHGQAVVVHGARCVGHGLCADACPVDAITVTLGDMEERRDIPALAADWEVVGKPGLYLAGEVTGHALVKTAILHGTAVAEAVHARRSGGTPTGETPAAAARSRTGPIESTAAAPSTPASWETHLPVDAGPVVILGAVGTPTDPGFAPGGERDAPHALQRDALTHLGVDAPTSRAGFAAIRSDGGPASAVLEPPPAAVESESAQPVDPDRVHELCIVGSGPAGLACSLRAKELGLDFVTLEQASTFGGTVAKYPRRKLVMTQPVSLPLYGTLKKSSYVKEELIGIWEQVLHEHDLPIRTDEVFEALDVDDDGVYRVRTARGSWRARHVCLALGRRGTPRKLGIPGEELPKVVYSLEDAEQYSDRHVLVVGGGDSAIEAAVGLSEQPGNTVTLSYRKKAFFRIKAKNERNLEAAVAEGRLTVLFESSPLEVTPDEVVIRTTDGERRLPNDDMFIMAGGIPPFRLLEEVGVSFDPADRPAEAPLVEQGTGLRTALLTSLGLTLLFLGWFLHFQDYYALGPEARFDSPRHEVLRPTSPVGLGAGIAGSALILVNLLYLVRRARFGAWLPGSLKAWMTSHVATGILAMLLILMHGSMQPRNSLGGHAFWSLAVLLVTGAIGRYFYAFVPHAANGEELALDEVRDRLAGLSKEWDDRAPGFARGVRDDLERLLAERRWDKGFFSRVKELFVSQRELTRFLAVVRRRGRAEGLDAEQVAAVLELTRRAHRAALMAAHYEDLRAVLGSWRFVHRWFALLMVLLATWHIVTALKYARVFQ